MAGLHLGYDQRDPASKMDCVTSHGLQRAASEWFASVPSEVRCLAETPRQADPPAAILAPRKRNKRSRRVRTGSVRVARHNPHRSAKQHCSDQKVKYQSNQSSSFHRQRQLAVLASLWIGVTIVVAGLTLLAKPKGPRILPRANLYHALRDGSNLKIRVRMAAGSCSPAAAKRL